MKTFRIAVLCVAAALPATAALAQTASVRDTGTHTQSSQATDADSLSWALCPIVYPVDQSPSDRGFHYIFYGNGFFINREGYLLTAAHVLSQLTDAPPYIVLRLPNAPPRLVKVDVVATDRDHDVALLRATPNPFEGRYEVRFLSLAAERPARQADVLAAAIRPSRLKDPHTFDAFGEDRPEGKVIGFETSELDKGSPQTELLLFAHEVLKGDSGAPVVAAGQEGAAVGFVEGRWLRTSVALSAASRTSGTNGIGAAVPIRYAVELLERQGVHWTAEKAK